MNPDPIPLDSLSPPCSPDKPSRQFSTPPSHLTLPKRWQMPNHQIGKKELRVSYEKGLKTVSRKLDFDESRRSWNEGASEAVKILKLR